jgi:serine/threonine protein kinase/tetratricopeptide (TPR) repeat protein
LPETPQISVTKTFETSRETLGRGTLFAGRYEIIEELGTGGMGRVYRAHDTKLNEEVALKLIKPEIAAERRVVERFRNEIKTARKIRHKNVCGMYDFHEEGKTLYLTMEYVRGEDLRSLIHRTKALTVGASLSIARQIAEGLSEAHKLGIVHRDLKPGNIMIDKDGQAKIMDFGIARVKQEKGVTGEGAIIGTPEYMSPEQVEGKPADPRSDIYALGIILFEILAGRPPFEGETAFAIAAKHKAEPPPIPKKLIPHIPEGLSKFILRCLEKDQTKRYQTAEELVADLSAIEQTLPTTDRVMTRKRTLSSREITVKLTPRKLILPAAGIVVLAAAAVVLFRFVLKKSVAYPPPLENSFMVVSFENQTGDKSQDNLQKAIPELLRTKFEQTGVRYVATLERMMQLSKQAGKPEPDFVDSGLGFELARRDGVKALVAGSFSRSGNIYVMTIKVLDIETRASLATANASGTGPESILSSQIDENCRQVFSKLNFTQAQLEKAKTSVAEYSTASPAAIENFVLGKEAWKKRNTLEAKKYFENAVKIDPEFALAYAELTDLLMYTGESDQGIRYAEKAIALGARLPKKERMVVDWTVAFWRDGDLEREIAILKDYIRLYPKEVDAYEWLGTAYRSFLGRYDESTKLYENVLELDPSQPFQWEIINNYIWSGNFNKAREETAKKYAQGSYYYSDLMGDISFLTGKLDEAISYFNRAKRLNTEPDFAYKLSNYLHYVYALKEDWSEALRYLDAYAIEAGTPKLKFPAYLLKAMDKSWLGMPRGAIGEIQEAQRLLGNARTTSEEQFDQTIIDWTRFWIALDRGDFAECRSVLPVWPERSSQMFFSKTFFKLVSVLARGSLELREKRMDLVHQTLKEMETLAAGIGPLKMPLSSSTDAERARFLLANFQAEVWLAEGTPDKAVAVLAGIVPPEPPKFSAFTQFLVIYLAPFLRDTLARAYEQMGDLDKAIAEYEKLMRVDLKIGPRFLPHPKYHYRLAKLFERKGENAKAAAEYRRFLELWKDTEAGQPEFEEAGKSLARVKGI